MELINYTIEEKYLDKYSELIKDVYSKYPMFAETKIKEIKKSFNRKNPFLQFGTWKNFLLLKGKKPVAHISAILDKRLPRGIGLVGYFDSINKIRYAKEVFDIAIKYLSKNQKIVIKGPVNLTTWQGFRISYPETNLPFFLEPFTRAYYRDLFNNYGFRIVQSNISTIQELKKTNFDKFEKEFKNLEKDRFIFEAIRDKNFLSALKEIYGVALRTFDNTWSFVKISLEEFVYYFKGFSKLINKHFLYVVRNQNRKAIAFFWGIPDFYSELEKRLVLKTMGVLPEYQSLGIGRALFYLVYRRAKEENIIKFIFSTMRQDNIKIRELTASGQDIYRKYSVYELIL